MIIPLPVRKTPEYTVVDAPAFTRDVAAAGRPVILRGLVRDWEAVRAGQQGSRALTDYLKRFAGPQPVRVISNPAANKGLFFYDDDLKGPNFTSRDMPLADFLTDLLAMGATPNPPSVAAQSLIEPVAARGFSAANPTPFPAGQAIARLWVGNAGVVQTHHDMSENLACAVAGRRRFTLFPPSQTANLYLGPFERTLAGSLISMVRLDAPDTARFPKFHEAWAEAETADLEPGDALYIPYMWWHHVQSFDPVALLVNYWWNDSAPELRPMEALIHALVSVRDLPPLQREAWRAMFEAFVFDAGDEPGAHLPQDVRGMQGQMSRARVDHLRGALAANIARRT